jgi:hypothetical protein
MEGDDKAFRFLFRHFLGLGFVVEDFDELGISKGVRGFCVSGTLFEYKGLYAILTAGHIIDDIRRESEKGRFKFRACYLLDHFGHEGVFQEPIAFDYEGAIKEYIYDKAAGLDFGLIALRDYYLALISKNGLKTVGEANWRLQDKIKFDFYLMLGLPFCWSDVRFFEGTDKQSKIEFLPSATCFRVDRRARRPGGVDITSYRRFIGHISPKIKIDNIDGMSGGPIYGFKKTDAGLKYWVVAVQSGWIERRRITFGCPLTTIGGLMDVAFEGLVERERGADHSTRLPPNL